MTKDHSYEKEKWRHKAEIKECVDKLVGHIAKLVAIEELEKLKPLNRDNDNNNTE